MEPDTARGDDNPAPPRPRFGYLTHADGTSTPIVFHPGDRPNVFVARYAADERPAIFGPGDHLVIDQCPRGHMIAIECKAHRADVIGSVTVARPAPPPAPPRRPRPVTVLCHLVLTMMVTMATFTALLWGGLWFAESVAHGPPGVPGGLAVGITAWAGTAVVAWRTRHATWRLAERFTTRWARED